MNGTAFSLQIILPEPHRIPHTVQYTQYSVLLVVHHITIRQFNELIVIHSTLLDGILVLQHVPLTTAPRKQ
jgi:hypothetical protein